MKRRSFIKSLGLMGGSVLVPSLMSGQGIFSTASASAAITSTGFQRSKISPRLFNTGQVQFVLPSVMPQVINVFLYGGPSELAGNLTNIDEINTLSKNKYPDNILSDGSRHTANNFWSNAGGAAMERMLAKKRMSIYRTVNRLTDDTRSHQPSIFSGLTGMSSEDEFRPGVGTNLASILSENNVITEESRFPFVSFDSGSAAFNRSDDLPLLFRPTSFNQNLENPYQRERAQEGGSGGVLDELADRMNESNGDRYKKVISAFSQRDSIDTFVGNLSDIATNNALVLPNPDFVDESNVTNERDEFIRYPTTMYGPKLKAAVDLVVNNDEALFVTVGSDSLGEWDDHNSSVDNDRYPSRMENLMRSLEVASQHLEAAGKGNVVINVYGEFGRNANLNDSLGWDHGNCQNLYTVSAAEGTAGSLPGRVLGKIVGETVLTGNADQNRLYIAPATGSYQCEPFAISATIYKYFGVQNPEVLTGGVAAIDEAGPTNLWADPNA